MRTLIICLFTLIAFPWAGKTQSDTCKIASQVPSDSTLCIGKGYGLWVENIPGYNTIWNVVLGSGSLNPTSGTVTTLMPTQPGPIRVCVYRYNPITNDSCKSCINYYVENCNVDSSDICCLSIVTKKNPCYGSDSCNLRRGEFELYTCNGLPLQTWASSNGYQLSVDWYLSGQASWDCYCVTKGKYPFTLVNSASSPSVYACGPGSFLISAIIKLTKPGSEPITCGVELNYVNTLCKRARTSAFDDTDSPQLKAYPNPASTEVNISLTESKIKHVRIIDLLGNTVSVIQNKNFDKGDTLQIGTNKLKPGSQYLIIVIDDQGKHHSTLISVEY